MEKCYCDSSFEGLVVVYIYVDSGINVILIYQNHRERVENTGKSQGKKLGILS